MGQEMGRPTVSVAVCLVTVSLHQTIAVHHHQETGLMVQAVVMDQSQEMGLYNLLVRLGVMAQVSGRVGLLRRARNRMRLLVLV